MPESQSVPAGDAFRSDTAKQAIRVAAKRIDRALWAMAGGRENKLLRKFLELLLLVGVALALWMLVGALRQCWLALGTVKLL